MTRIDIYLNELIDCIDYAKRTLILQKIFNDLESLQSTKNML